MSNRSNYQVEGSWDSEARYGEFITQSADLVDTTTGRCFYQGAFRVVDGRTGQPVKGKGGTVPFKGETAWSDAERLAMDLQMKELYK